MDVEGISELESRFLLTLFNMTRGRADEYESKDEVAVLAGVSAAETDSVARRLYQVRLIRLSDGRDRVCLTRRALTVLSLKGY